MLKKENDQEDQRLPLQGKTVFFFAAQTASWKTLRFARFCRKQFGLRKRRLSSLTQGFCRKQFRLRKRRLSSLGVVAFGLPGRFLSLTLPVSPCFFFVVVVVFFFFLFCFFVVVFLCGVHRFWVGVQTSR